MSTWHDITSYSRGEQNRVPISWELRAGGIRLIVTRRHMLEGWYIAADPWFDYDTLQSTEIEDAKQEAINALRQKLTGALNDLPGKEG